jgi:predicted nuclease of predicted toxin-antitoxin system
VKLLLDACIWGGAIAELRAAGHDVVWAGDWPSDPGDDELLARAHSEHRVLVTLDKDFGELAVVHARPHSGILRIVDIPARRQAGVCARVLGLHGELLGSGAIITAEPGRLRVRPGPEHPSSV